MHKILRLGSALLLTLVVAACATDNAVGPDDNMRPSMAWSVDGTGNGFVGKGDVQLIYGWNNKALQDGAADVRFRVSSVVVTEYSWTCDKDTGPQTQERSRTTTVTTEGIVSNVARLKNQITGFNLTGFSGGSTTTTESEGPKLWECATGWSQIDQVTDGPTPVGDSGLQVSINGTDWIALPVPLP